MRVWALTSSREGDNAQVFAVAEAMGVPYEVRRFQNRSGAIALNLIFGPRAARSRVEMLDSILPPWPDLIIAAGTQSEPILAMIRAASDGSLVRQIFLGRPWMNPDCYDLVVTTPQYQVPPAANVMELDLPMHRVTREAIAREAERWEPRIALLPHPRIAVLLGGSINRYTLDARAAQRIAVEVGARAGSMLVCNSYRTPPAAMQALTESVAVPAFIHDWHNPDGAENPYLAFLGLADEIVVTGDSISMLAEASTTEKPVYIFDLGEGRYGMRPGGSRPTVAVPGPWLGSAIRAGLKDLKVRFTNSIIPRRLHRDTRPIHARLVESGRAAWFGDSFTPTRSRAVEDSAAAVAARIKAVCGQAASGLASAPGSRRITSKAS